MELPDLISPVMAGPFFQALLKAAPGSLAMASPQPAVHASDMILALTHWLMGLLPAAAVLMIVYHALMKTLAQDEYTAAQHVKSIRSVIIGLIFGLGATGLVAFLINFVDPCSVTNGSDLNHLCRNPASAASGLPAGGPANKPRGSGDWWECRAHNDDGTWQVNYKQNYKPECDQRTNAEIAAASEKARREQWLVESGLKRPRQKPGGRPLLTCQDSDWDWDGWNYATGKYKGDCDLYDDDPETSWEPPVGKVIRDPPKATCGGYDDNGLKEFNPYRNSDPEYKPECDMFDNVDYTEFKQPPKISEIIPTPAPRQISQRPKQPPKKKLPATGCKGYSEDGHPFDPVQKYQPACDWYDENPDTIWEFPAGIVAKKQSGNCLPYDKNGYKLAGGTHEPRCDVFDDDASTEYKDPK